MKQEDVSMSFDMLGGDINLTLTHIPTGLEVSKAGSSVEAEALRLLCMEELSELVGKEEC